MTSHLGNISSAAESVRQGVNPPEMQEVIRGLVNELLNRFAWFFPILKAIGWAVVAYFVILIIIALVRFRRSKKHIRLLEEMNSTLKEIKERLPEKKIQKKEKDKKE